MESKHTIEITLLLNDQVLKARSLYKKLHEKGRKIDIIVRHHIVPFYNPVYHTYETKHFNPNTNQTWEIWLCDNKNSTMFLVKSSIESIEKIVVCLQQ